MSSASGFHRRLIALTRKEVRQLLRDKSNLFVGLLLPLALILLFGYGLSFDVKDAPEAERANTSMSLGLASTRSRA